MSQRPLDHQQAVPAFGEAVAQWRLALRTEVKRASSLPTSMFDACDPMLETRLAETTEAMLALLHEPDQTLAQPTEPGEKRLEQVAAAELAALPNRIRSDHQGAASPDVDTHLDVEYLGILTDTCSTADGDARAGAAALLVRDFGIAPDTDLERATRELATGLQDTLQPETLDAVCRRIAAAVALTTAGTSDAGAAR
jgi:hypothetical protein